MKILYKIPCSTGCQDPGHMITYVQCGAKYHFGIGHDCPTACFKEI